MDKDGKNESVVEAMSATGRVTAQELYVREQPTTKGKEHPITLKKAGQVHVMGLVDTGTIGVAWAPGDAMLAAVGGGKRVAVWRRGSWGTPAATWEVGNDYQSAVAFHPTRPVLAVASHDGHVRIYGVAGDQLAKPPLLLEKDVGGGIRGIAFSADGTGLWIAAGPPAGKVFRFTVAATP